jgi:hypothetical protein
MSGRVRVAAVGLAVVCAVAAQAQTRLPSGLTPLGPVQTPRPSAPAEAQGTPAPPSGGPIQSESLPTLTAPDPAFSRPPAAAPLLLAAPATPASLPTPSAPAPPVPAPPASAPPPPPANVAPSPPVPWLPRGSVDLLGLDKVTARATTLSGKVGATLHYGTLSIVLRACAVRPPDQPADAAAFLDVSEADGQSLFHGWMVASVPSLGVIEHPVYDLRVTGCRN